MLKNPKFKSLIGVVGLIFLITTFDNFDQMNWLKFVNDALFWGNSLVGVMLVLKFGVDKRLLAIGCLVVAFVIASIQLYVLQISEFRGVIAFIITVTLYVTISYLLGLTFNKGN